MKKTYISVVIFCLFSCARILCSVVGGGSITQNINTYSCAGGEGSTVICNFTINAVGDLKAIEPKVTAVRLGVVSEPKMVSITMPAIGGQRLFSLTTSQSYSENFVDKTLVGNPMELLFMSLKPDAEALKLQPDAVAMIKVYRRLSGESLWTEMSTTLSSVMPSDLSAMFVIEPNGNVTFGGQDGAPLTTICLGKAVVG